MSRTIRRKGFNKRTSARRFSQYNNEFYHLCKDTYRCMIIRGDTTEIRLKNNQDWLDEVASEVHREASYVEERWHRYVTPIPRIMHKMEIKRSLRNDTDYNWDEDAARKYEKGLCYWLWD